MRLSLIAAAVVSTALVSLAWAGSKGRTWGVAGKKPVAVADSQYSDAPVIPCREVAFRSKFSSLNKWGPLKAYPVVRAPNGKVFSGFVRSYGAGKLNDQFISWFFPVQFRSPHTTVTSENDAVFGDRLTDAEKLPSGTYQVKWVFNDRLVDTGDSFDYTYSETRK